MSTRFERGIQPGRSEPVRDPRKPKPWRWRAPGRAIALVALLAGAAMPPAVTAASIDDFRLRSFDVGGDFALTDQDGARRSLRDFAGKVVVLFFGFTHCPDVCPTTMIDMGRLLAGLGPDAERVQAVFVTVDPERDTPERLKQYLGYFYPAIVGMTGSVAEVRRVAARFDTRFDKRAFSGGDGYSIDHTGYVYILDGTGKVRYVVPHDAGTPMMHEGVRALLDGDA